MRRLEIPVGLVDRAVGTRGPIALDEAMIRRVERALHRTEPDPLFRRRLRGQVVNQYVAAREGLVRQSGPRRQMGKLGRSVLYASLVLALSVSAAGAASQDSLPGEALYGVKLQLEEIRMRIAPSSVRQDLAAMALSERVDELERLAEAGAWQLVTGAAARVTDAELALAAMESGTTPEGTEAAEQAVDVLEAVLMSAPAAAQDGLQRALEVVGGDSAAIDRPRASRPAVMKGAMSSNETPARTGKPEPSERPGKSESRSPESRSERR